MGHLDCLVDGHPIPRPCHCLPIQVIRLLSSHSRIHSRLVGVGFRKKRLGYETYGDLCRGFYNEAVVHLPFVSSIHNLWRAKLLMDLNYGMANFRMRDSKEVQEILVAAGKGSYSESMYEAGPQSVTQVHDNCFKDDTLGL